MRAISELYTPFIIYFYFLRFALLSLSLSLALCPFVRPEVEFHLMRAWAVCRCAECVVLFGREKSHLCAVAQFIDNNRRFYVPYQSHIFTNP